MNAIVTAGGETEPKQPLYEIAHGGLKSMIEVAGKPMVQWVLDAMGKSTEIERVVVVGLPPETDLVCAHPLVLLPDEGDMLRNIQSAAREILRIDPQAEYALLSASDIPALRAEMIDWLICQVKDVSQDIYFTVIDRGTMEAGFPDSKQTYTHLKDTDLCVGDLHCFRLKTAAEDTPLWKRLIESRKKPLRQASILGYDTMLFLMLRQLTLKDAEATVCKRLGIKGQAVLSPYPEIGMDVDKPFQLEIIRETIARRHERHSSRPE